MQTVILLAAVIAVACALKVPHITGTTPPPVKCDNKLCDGKYDGNYAYKDPHTHAPNEHYFLQCSGGVASCQACWPLHLVYKPKCDQCLYSQYDDCVTTKSWRPATTFACPDKCPHRGPHFSGNIADPSNPHQYVACWKGVTVGCIACPAHLKFNEKWNACLYSGIYKTEPSSQKRPHKPHIPYYQPKTTTTTTTRRPYYRNNRYYNHH